MNDINKAIFTGRLTRDPDLRSTGAGLEILNLGVAINDRRRGTNGDWEDHANFVDCKLFGNRAAAVAPMLCKGQKVTIEGRLSFSEWNKDGQKRSKLEVLVDNIDFTVQKQAQTTDDDLPF